MFGLQNTVRALAPALALLVAAVGLPAPAARAASVSIDVNVDKPTTELSPVLYGLFFEDINYAADGGLYAELVENRSFEYYSLDPRVRGNRMQPLDAWEPVQRGDATVELQVTDESPLNEKNAHYLKLKLRELTSDEATKLGDIGTAGVANRGFRGIPVKSGAHYDFSVFARRTGSSSAPLTVALEDPSGEVLASGETPAPGSDWQQLDLVLTPSTSSDDARLVITTTGGGELDLDMVSLFPRDTFKGRRNGMRPDLAQALADLNPSFMRFPGGCILHGAGLENTYRWKDTVGPVEARKPNWNRWGYHQTYGLGYFEYFQLCEDIGATALPVVPVGVSCGFNRPMQSVPIDELQPWIDDMNDLVEFANGPIDSEWGKVRAEMGHPEPFNLKYLCLGNEEHDTPEFRERIPYFVKALREAHPEIKIIGTSGLSENIPLYPLMTELGVYSSDEHYYLPPEWYLRNTDRFDSFDRAKPKIFVGEYASEGNTLYNAVAEAAFLTGVERNGDIVDMTCYAPLFAKIGNTQWPRADLIWFTNTDLMRTPNYYVQQLFASNKGDAYLDNTVTMSNETSNQPTYDGRVGIGTWTTSIVVESARLNGKPIDLSGGNVLNGTFEKTAEGFAQTDAGTEAAICLATDRAEGDKIVYEVRAKKTGGREGFLLVFGGQGPNDYYWVNFGGWTNARHGIERRRNGQSQTLARNNRGRVQDNVWYDLKVELTPGRIQGFIDGEQVIEYTLQPQGVSVSPTLDKSSGELIVKMVNPREEAVLAKINIAGASRIASEADLTVLAGSPGAVNTIESETIAPKTDSITAGKTTQVELPAMSVSVIRVKVQ